MMLESLVNRDLRDLAPLPDPFDGWPKSEPTLLRNFEIEPREIEPLGKESILLVRMGVVSRDAVLWIGRVSGRKSIRVGSRVPLPSSGSESEYMKDICN